MNKSRKTITTFAKKAATAGAMTAMAASMTLSSVSGVLAADSSTAYGTNDVALSVAEQNTDTISTISVKNSESSEGSESSETGVTLADQSILEEGQYSVGVSLQQFSSPDKASMASGSLVSTAILTVEDGQATIELTFQTLQIYSLYGNLTELYFFNSKEECASAQEQYRQASTIISYRDDAKTSDLSGNVIENVTMPEKVSFTLPYTDSQDVYIGIVVDVMQLMGMDFTEAVLRIDYDSAEEIVDKTELETTLTDAKAIVADGYTESSFADLTNAIAAAELVYANEDATQKQVNAEITSIENAVAALTLEPVVTVLDQLENGVYEVSLNLWNATADKASMADSSINGNAKIVVEDGVYKMYLYTKPMTLGTITASLQELKVYSADGNYVDATIETTDDDGNPTSFSFLLPSGDEYISVAVNPHVAMMGNQDIAARLKIDYSTITYVSASLEDQTEDGNDTSNDAASDDSTDDETNKDEQVIDDTTTGAETEDTDTEDTNTQDTDTTESTDTADTTDTAEQTETTVQTSDVGKAAPFAGILISGSAILLALISEKKARKVKKVTK